MKILVSACLLGEPVRYDGSHNILTLDALKALKEDCEVISFCPEMEGGLETPRIPSEILKDRVINQDGKDVTKFFEEGANKALKLCQEEGVSIALLKAKSPSCGNVEIYDGTFSKVLVAQAGVTAKLLMEKGISVFNEDQIPELLVALNKK